MYIMLLLSMLRNRSPTFRPILWKMLGKKIWVKIKWALSVYFNLLPVVKLIHSLSSFQVWHGNWIQGRVSVNNFKKHPCGKERWGKFEDNPQNSSQDHEGLSIQKPNKAGPIKLDSCLVCNHLALSPVFALSFTVIISQNIVLAGVTCSKTSS